MRWVQDGINSFGGNPARVFIVGQSAGSASVGNHLVRKESWGLFSAAGMESGGFPDGTSVDDRESSFNSLLGAANCTSVACLLQLPADLLMSLDEGWVPIVDGVDLVDSGISLASRGHLAPVPLIVGSTMEDGNNELTCEPWSCNMTDFANGVRALFGLTSSETDALVNLYSNEQPRPGGNYSKWWWAYKHATVDEHNTCRSRRMARWITDAGQDAYWYYWTYPPKGYNGRYPSLAHHACEQPFIFHVLSETPGQIADDNGAYHIEPEERDFSAAVVRYWASFAASGKPEGDVPWPRYQHNLEQALVIGDVDGSVGSMAFEVAKVRNEICSFWDSRHSNASTLPIESTFTV